MKMCQYLSYFTKNYLMLVKPNLCPSRIIYFCHLKIHVPLLPLILSILVVEDNNQILDLAKFKLLICRAVAVGMGF